MVFHFSLKGAFLDVAVVCHTALEGAVLDVAVVFHTALALEGTTADGAAVCHVSFKGAFLYGVQVCHTAIESAARDCSSRECYSGVVCHFSRKGAVAIDGAVVCHTARALEGTARDFSSGVVGHCCIECAARDCSSGVVCHYPIEGTVGDGSFGDRSAVKHSSVEDAAGNFRTRLSHNRTLHSPIGRPSCIGFGLGVVEIKRSILQSQCLGATIVTPVVADIAFPLLWCQTGKVRQTVLHDEFWESGCCKGPQGEHGEHHAQCQDQAENAFFHRGRPPFLPRAATKAARSFVSGFIIP